MSWLVANGRVLASAEVADTGAARRRGLLGRDGIDGALVLTRCRWVHTIGMRFTIDVAHVDAFGVVLRTATMRRHRVGPPVLHAHMVIEGSAGAFARWGLNVGDVVELRTTDEAGRGGGQGLPAPTEPAVHVTPPRTLRHLTPEQVATARRALTPELAAAG